MTSHAGDPLFRFFLNRFIVDRSYEIGATEAAAFDVRPDSFADTRFDLVLHIRPDQSTTTAREAAIVAFKEIIAPCVAQSKDGAIEVGTPDGGGSPQFCLVTLLYTDGSASFVIVYITRAKDDAHARKLLSMLQSRGPLASDDV